MPDARKPCYVYQPWGLGDLLYIQKIIRHFRDLGHEVIVPVRADLSWIGNYLNADGIEYVSFETAFPRKKEFVALANAAEFLTQKAAPPPRRHRVR